MKKLAIKIAKILKIVGPLEEIISNK